MNPSTGTGRSPNPILEAIAARRRRHVITVLRDQQSPVSERELATRIAAIEEEKPSVDVTREEVSRVTVDLVHAQLPRLEVVSLVERDVEAKTVTTTDHPALDDPNFRQLVETDADGWDDVIANLASSRRRLVLSVLESRSGTTTRSDLAREVLRRETGTEVEPTADAPRDVETALHHVHLPKLAEAGLVTYDSAEGTATYEGHPELDETWLDCASEETPRTIVNAVRGVSDV